MIQLNNFDMIIYLLESRYIYTVYSIQKKFNAKCLNSFQDMIKFYKHAKRIKHQIIQSLLL